MGKNKRLVRGSLSAFDKKTDELKEIIEQMLKGNEKAGFPMPGVNYQSLLDEAMAGLKDTTIISAKAIELSKTVMIIFKMDSNELWLAEHNMRDIVRSIQPIGTIAYRLRMAGKMENGLTGLTITLSAEAVAALDCAVDVVDWKAVADEYHVASGLK